MPLRPDVFLETALLALRRVSKLLGNHTLGDYLADELCQSAVERQLEIAGDALGQLRKLDAVLFGKKPQTPQAHNSQNRVRNRQAKTADSTRLKPLIDRSDFPWDWCGGWSNNPLSLKVPRDIFTPRLGPYDDTVA